MSVAADIPAAEMETLHGRPVRARRRSEVGAPEAVQPVAPMPRMTGAERARLTPYRAIRIAVRETEDLRRRYAAAVAAGRKRLAHNLQWAILNSPGVKVAALYSAVRHQRRRVRCEQFSAHEIVETAFSLSMCEAPDEAVRLYPMFKAKGGWRPIFAFGPRNYARQLVFLWAIEPRAKGLIDTRQHAAPGRSGRDGAVAAAEDFIHQGAHAACEVDVSNCFGMIGRDWAIAQSVSLGIPEQIARSVLFPRDDRLITPVCQETMRYNYSAYPESQALRTRGRLGLPQGAASSSILAEIAVAHLLSEVPTAQVSTYCDNLMVMAPKRTNVEGLLNTLDEAARHHPAGQLALTRGPIRRVSEGFDFLGYNIHSYKGHVHIEPTRAAKSDGAKKIERRLRDVADGKPGATRRLRRTCRGWASAFSRWSRVNQVVGNTLFWAR